MTTHPELLALVPDEVSQQHDGDKDYFWTEGFNACREEVLRRVASLAAQRVEAAPVEPVATVCLETGRYAHGHMVEVQLQIKPVTPLPIGTKLYLHPPQAQASAGEVDWRRVESAASAYVEDYEMMGEDEQGREGSYTPNEIERMMILDAMFGLFSDDDFTAAIQGRQA